MAPQLQHAAIVPCPFLPSKGFSLHFVCGLYQRPTIAPLHDSIAIAIEIAWSSLSKPADLDLATHIVEPIYTCMAAAAAAAVAAMLLHCAHLCIFLVNPYLPVRHHLHYVSLLPRHLLWLGLAWPI
jgi:hypothetical protein